MSKSDFGGPSPLKFWGRKRSFNYTILRLYCKLSPHWNKISSTIENGLQTAIPPEHAYQIW